MKREWKPGDVALRIGQDGSTCISLVTRADRDRIYCSSHGHPLEIHWHHESGGWNPIDDPPRFGDYRPLVVIDPEDREQVERLADLNERHTPDGSVSPTESTNAMQAALREFANPTPPKPEEPTGLGAVVEDADGKKWFRMALENQTWPGEVWQEQYDNADRWSQWQDIAVARVLSEGVTA